MSRLALALLSSSVALILFTACSDGGPAVVEDDDATQASAAALQVVTTSNIVAEWVRQISGGHVEVFSLVPVGADPHSFQPGARAITRIADADLVLSIGLGLEQSWLAELLENASRDPQSIVELAELVDPLEFASAHGDEEALLEELEHVLHEVEDGEITPAEALEEIEALVADDDEFGPLILPLIHDATSGASDPDRAVHAIEDLVHDDHGHGPLDPHFWFDPLRVKLAVSDIRARLARLDPPHAEEYMANALAYEALLDELHAWTVEQVAAVPDERRLLLTSHDSLGYFAARYGFEVVGVILAMTTEATPSATDLAELIETIERVGAPAVFGETTESERLAAMLAAESGARLVRLHSGSLGVPGSGAETYIAMVRSNVTRIVEALG